MKAAPFISRGDRSGTHVAELALWKDAGIDITKDRGSLVQRDRTGDWGGPQHRLRIQCLRAFRPGTWLDFKNRGDPAILLEGDKPSFNQYGVMLVNPSKHPTVKKEAGERFIDWLISSEGQSAIAGYKIEGQQLFYPNATIPTA